VALHGFLKRVRIRNQASFHLAFHLTNVPEHLELLVPFKALGGSIATSAQRRISHSAVAHFETRRVTSRYPTKRVKWTAEEDAMLVRMREDGSSWEEISAALPSRNPGAIQVRYSMKLSSGSTGSRKHGRP
jgi:hypothetical protein